MFMLFFPFSLFIKTSYKGLSHFFNSSSASLLNAIATMDDFPFFIGKLMLWSVKDFPIIVGNVFPFWAFIFNINNKALIESIIFMFFILSY